MSRYCCASTSSNSHGLISAPRATITLSTLSPAFSPCVSSCLYHSSKLFTSPLPTNWMRCARSPRSWPAADSAKAASASRSARPVSCTYDQSASRVYRCWRDRPCSVTAAISVSRTRRPTSAAAVLCPSFVPARILIVVGTSPDT